MSTNPVQSALKSLLPSTTTAPPHLQSAATSLLSVSRQRAANLKPEEEIARTHACAEIACKRLRAHLRLPNIKSGNGAPCRPAVYKRLMTFLEGILADVDLMGTPSKPRDAAPGQKTPTTAGGRSTGKKRMIEDLTMEDDDDVNVAETPTKKQKTTGTTPSTTPVTAKAKKINGFLGKIQASTGKGKGKGKSTEPEAPSHILPTVRSVCKAFKVTKMIPHVYTGVVIGINLGGLRLETDEALDEEAQDKLKIRHFCLVLASFAVTLTRMHEGDMTQETFDKVAERGLAVVELNDLEGTLKREVEEWISKMTAWATDDPSMTSWIDSIPLNDLPPFKLPPVGRTGGKVGKASGGTVIADKAQKKKTTQTQRYEPGRLSRREEIVRELEKEDPDDVLLPGLGTMVHDGIDYFSAERVAEYEEWKADILRRVGAMDRDKGGGRPRTTAVAG